MSSIRYKSILFGLLFVMIILPGIYYANAETTNSEKKNLATVTDLAQADEPTDYTNCMNNSIDLPAYLDTGFVINSKLKSVAAGMSVDLSEYDTNIKAIHMADSLPNNFESTDENTISIDSSPVPIYIFFDNTDDNGVMFVYSSSKHIVANPFSNGVLYRMSAIDDISGVSDWDTSQVTNLSAAFVGTSSLSDISALSNWNTGNVISFAGTFYQSGIIDASPLSDWDTSNAVTMTYMFAKAKEMIKIDVSNWNTSKVTNMSCMFCVGDSYKGNGQLTEITGLNHLDVSSVTDMTCMFYGAGNMTHYDIADWDVSNVESFNHMFCDNFKLESLDLSSWNVSSVKTMFDMFDDNFALTTIGDVSQWDTSSLIDAGGWLNHARSFIGENGILDLSGWNTENLMVVGEMFREISCETIDLSGWTFDSITNDSWAGAGSGIYYESGNRSNFKGLSGMFLNAKKLNTTRVSFPGYISYKNAVARGTATADMWKGVPEGYFTIPHIPQPMQKIYHSFSFAIHHFLYNFPHSVLDCLNDLL